MGTFNDKPKFDDRMAVSNLGKNYRSHVQVTSEFDSDFRCLKILYPKHYIY